MPKKLWVGAAVAAALLALGAYFGSPLLAANALRSAAMAGDVDKLQRLVDFPAVRESLKGQLNALIVQSLQSDPEMRDNPFAGFAAVLAPAFVNQAVDGYVTAEGLGAMMRAEKPTVSASPGNEQSIRPSAAAPAGPSGPPDPKFEHRYRDLDTYEIRSLRAANPAEHFSLILHRHGLFGWKLARIELPKTLPQPARPTAAAAPSQVAARPDALLARWDAENSACRGGSGDDPATDAACEARGRTDAELARVGWCYGENAAYGYQSEWRRCGDPKFASVDQAEREAEVDRAAHAQ